MLKAVGKLVVSSPGTPVRATSVYDDPAKVERVHGVLFQTIPGNTGLVYIGDSPAMDKTTLEHVVAVLAVPTENTLPTFSAALTWSANNIMLESLYVDADQTGDGAICSVLIA